MSKLNPIQWVGIAVIALMLLNGKGGCSIIPIGTTAGPRDVIFWRESAKDTPQIGMMISALRNGQNAEYLKSKGHTFTVVDPHDTNPTGGEAAIVTKWKGEADPSGRTLIIADQKTGKLVAKYPMPDKPTATEVLDAIKKNGG